MVVDDNPLISGVIRSVLQSERIDVTTCANGKEALESLKTDTFDLIICDVMMPVMGGYELYEKVRNDSKFYHVPFLFLTALDSEDEKSKGISSGADDYLVKPFDPKQLTTIVKGKLARARGIKSQSEEQYEKYRRSVLHTLSHEFRTPLVAINTGTELLLDRPELEQGKIRNLVEAIQRGGARLERLVTDFMLLQQIQAGLSERLAKSSSRRIDVKEFVTSLIERLSSVAKEAHRSVKFESSIVDAVIEVFETQIYDATERVLHNAFKFSKPEQLVDVSVITLGDELAIRIKDRGVGMSPARCSEISQPFRQLDRDKLEQQGSGIGLSIAQAYLGYNKAKLDIVSTEGVGTEVSILIPLVD
jgi:signal transduction histidine kinase